MKRHPKSLLQIGVLCLLLIVTILLIINAKYQQDLRSKSAGPAVTFNPTVIPVGEPEIANPGRGFAYYGDGNGPSSTWQLSDYYVRVCWRDLEPTQGQYNFSSIDKGLADVTSKGGIVGLRVMPATEWQLNCIPDYLKSLMPKGFSVSGSTGSLYIPDWNDPDYVSRFQALFQALGAKYANNPRIGFIDMSGYGCYAEWHMYCGNNPPIKYPSSTGATDVTQATLKALIDAQTQAFPNKQFLTLTANQYAREYALSLPMVKPVGQRRDCLGVENISFSPPTYWQKAPIFLEYCGGANYQKGYDGAVATHATWIGSANLGSYNSLSAANQSLIKQTILKSGYRYVLNNLNFPSQLGVGQQFTVTSNWSNVNIAPTYYDWNVMIQLKNTSGTVAWEGKSTLNLKTLLPENLANVTDTFTLPATVPNGTYAVAVKVVDPGNIFQPMKLAIQSRQSDGSYNLGTVTVTGSSGVIPSTQPTGAIQPATIVPTFFCLSGKPCTSPMPSQETPSSGPSQQVSPTIGTPPTDIPPANPSPCPTTNSVSSDTSHAYRHRGSNGLLNILLRLILQLLNLILRLLGGGGIIPTLPPQPAPQPNPTAIPNPGNPTPTTPPTNPCPPVGQPTQQPQPTTPILPTTPVTQPVIQPTTPPTANCTQTISPGTSISTAQAGMAPGGVLCLKGGTYSQKVTLSKAGTASAPITIKASPGETPVIDGTGVGVAHNDGLFNIGAGANYLIIDGLTIQRSSARGLVNDGSHVTVQNSRILYSADAGILTTNWSGPVTDVLYQNNELGWNVWSNPCHNQSDACNCTGYNCNWESSTNHYSGGSGQYGPVTFRGNHIHDGVGEGMVLGNGDQVISNIVHDNWSVDIYMDGPHNCLVEGNLVYESEQSKPSGPGQSVYRLQAIGIMLADEGGQGSNANNTIRNNIVVNTSTGIRYWNAGGSSGLKNHIFDNNTIVNTWENGIDFAASSNNTNTVVRNNIVLPRSGNTYTNGNANGVTQANNLFTSKGSTTDPKLPGEGGFSFDPNSYKLQTGSTGAIDKGTASSATKDYFGTGRPRGAAFDIGAHEF